MNKNILASAIATVILLASGSANAEFAITADVTAPQNIANETTPAALAVQVTTVSGDPVITSSLVDDLPTGAEVRLVLSGGAEWLAAPVLTEGGVGALDFAALGGIAGNTATYVVTTASTVVNETMEFEIDDEAGMFDLSAVADGDTVTLEIQAFNPATGSFSANGVTTEPLFAKVDLATLAVLQNDIIADVSSPTPSFSEFTTGAGTVTACTNATSLVNNTSSQAILAGDVEFTLKGDFSDATIANGTGTTAWVINAAETEATANLAGDLVGGATVTTLCPVLTFSGDNSIPVQNYTFSSESAATTGFSAAVQGVDQNMIVITHNGSSFSTNSSGPSNKFKISELSGRVASSVAISAVDGSGAEITATGSPALPTTIAGNETIVVQGADIMTNFPSAARIDFTIESEEVSIANVKKTADGVTLTVNTTSNNQGAI